MRILTTAQIWHRNSCNAARSPDEIWRLSLLSSPLPAVWSAAAHVSGVPAPCLAVRTGAGVQLIQTAQSFTAFIFTIWHSDHIIIHSKKRPALSMLISTVSEYHRQFGQFERDSEKHRKPHKYAENHCIFRHIIYNINVREGSKKMSIINDLLERSAYVFAIILGIHEIITWRKK